MKLSKLSSLLFKKVCAACGEPRREMNKEHYFPVWLIERTNTVREGIAWAGKENIPALSATVPLCKRCNSDFGREIESPMAKIFDDIEAGRGLSDTEAELIVRWMWKFEGLAWIFSNPQHRYTERYSLRDRVLLPIDGIRGQITLAVGLAKNRDSDFVEGAMGIDSFNRQNAIFVSGVFSRVAIAVVLSEISDKLPDAFSKYQLQPTRNSQLGEAKLFFPKEGFDTCTEAVYWLKLVSPSISLLHDQYGEKLRARIQTPN